MKKTWLTAREAAEYLGYKHMRTLANLRVTEGAGPRFTKTPTGSIRYKTEWLDDWMEKKGQGEKTA